MFINLLYLKKEALTIWHRRIGCFLIVPLKKFRDVRIQAKMYFCYHRVSCQHSLLSTRG